MRWGALLTVSIANLFSLSCRLPREPAPRAPVSVVTEAEPSTAERACAWYGSARDGVLYFGESAFWWAMRRSGGDPTADLASPGPQRIGRFDLASGRLLPALDVGTGEDRSGVWDVLAHPNGRVYFTTFFETSGWVDPRSGRTVRLGPASIGWNELAVGPEGGVLTSRYGDPSGGRGSLVWLDADGAVRRELPLEGPDGYAVAPKTPAWDPLRHEAWVTTDLLPPGDSGLPPRHDALVVDLEGHLLRRYGGGPGEPEVQFVRFGADGAGWLAIADGTRLELALLAPGSGVEGLDAARRVLLDDAFVPGLDFAQDVQPAPDGGVVVTRWSGRIHLVDPAGRVRTVRLPALEQGGLYYTGVVDDDRLCATYCAAVTVVCRAAPR